MMLQIMSQAILPFIIMVIIGNGIYKKTAVYDAFIKGAGNGLIMTWKILPTLIGLMVAVGVLRASGFLDFASAFLMKLLPVKMIQTELVTLGIMKMFSSSAATGLLLDIFQNFGCDSFTGRAASLMLSSTETIFYTISIYFISIRVSKTRWTLAGAVLCSLAGITASILIAYIM